VCLYAIPVKASAVLAITVNPTIISDIDFHMQADPMTSISLNLPDDLALESARVAEKLGLSRTELIRQAVRHELDAIAARLEREAMAGALASMQGDENYRLDSDALEAGLDARVAEEPGEWWRG
jgi:predicted transcriptional regulator